MCDKKMDFKKLEQFLKENKQPAFRLKQIKKAVFEDVIISFDEMTSLPKDLRDVLKNEFRILPFFAKNILASKKKNSYKALLELEDGRVIETVLMNMKDENWSVCASSQAGCAMRCAFCATGAGGFFRNLTSEEIWGQVLFWKQYMKNKRDCFVPRNDKTDNRISNIVYMGMGEPFNNLKNVFESIKVLIDKDAFGMGQRSISVSTCGIVPGIEKFGEQFPQVNLAISLHSANDKLRSELMPVNKTYNLEKLADSLRRYFKKSNRQIFIEYILLDGVNDNLKNAKELVDYLRNIGHPHLLHVNFIIFNPINNIGVIASGAKQSQGQIVASSLDGLGGLLIDHNRLPGRDDKLFRPSSKEQARKFKDFLIKNGISATIRKSLGQDIKGACGQLAGEQVLGSSF